MSKATDQAQHTPVVSGRSGTTDSIRHMLREQKKQCSSLHANPLFREFWHRSKPPQDAQPPVIDDLEAEGQTRLFDVIRSAAEARAADRAGVWASFGQPYACLGQPQQLDTSAAALLPHLNRDDIEAAAAPKQPQQQLQRRGGTRVSRTGSAGPTPGAIAAAAATAVAAAAAATAGDGSAGSGGAAAAGALGSSGHKADAAKLLHHKTVMHFSTVDRLEAAFPAAAVQQAERRQQAAKVKPRRFYNKSRAEADLADAAASYGHHALPSKTLPGHDILQHHQTAAAAAAAAASHNPRDSTTGAAASNVRSRASKTHAAAPVAGADGGPAACDAKHAFFITQQAATGAATAVGAAASTVDGTAAAARRISMSMSVDADTAHARRSSIAAAGDFTEAAASQHPHSGQQPQQQQQQQQPCFGPITDLTMQPIASSSSPVIAWHNDFVGVRHAGYADLQQALWQRSQDRAVVRGQAAAAGSFSRGLMQQLGQAGGRLQPGWIPGTNPESPFARSTALQQQQQHSAAGGTPAAADAAAALGPRLIKPAEVELLEQFYESLCSLVERQRLSDPLSLTLVHKVKALLESGTFLQPTMLQACIDCVADFSSSCGLKRFNRFLLPLLTFVRKCTGVGQQEFDALVEAAGIGPVVYEQEPAAAAAAAAANEAVCLQQHDQHEQQQQLEVVPEDEDGQLTAVVDADGAPAAAGHQGEGRELQDRLQSSRTRGSSSSSNSRPQMTPASPAAPPAASAGATEAVGALIASLGPASPTSPGRGSSAGQCLRLDRCTSTAAGGSVLSTARGNSSSSGARASCSGTNTSRSRAGSSAVVRTPEGPTVPTINAAAAAAAAEIMQAIQSAPASQRALAAVAAAGDGSIRVKVPGVAGPVELVSAEAAAAAAAGGSDNTGGRVCEGTDGAEAGAAGGVGEEALPDLGEDEEGQPLSRRLRHQEGLASWGAAAGSSIQADHPAADGGDGDVAEAATKLGFV